MLRNTEIKGISRKFAYLSPLISRQEAKETKTQGNGKVKDLKDGTTTTKKYKPMKKKWNERDRAEVQR